MFVRVEVVLTEVSTICAIGYYQSQRENTIYFIPDDHSTTFSLTNEFKPFSIYLLRTFQPENFGSHKVLCFFRLEDLNLSSVLMKFAFIKNPVVINVVCES